MFIVVKQGTYFIKYLVILLKIRYTSSRGDIMYSSVIQGTMYKDFKNIKQLLGISEERLTDMLYGMSSEEFSVLSSQF